MAQFTGVQLQLPPLGDVYLKRSDCWTDEARLAVVIMAGIIPWPETDDSPILVALWNS